MSDNPDERDNPYEPVEPPEPERRAPADGWPAAPPDSEPAGTATPDDDRAPAPPDNEPAGTAAGEDGRDDDARDLEDTWTDTEPVPVSADEPDAARVSPADADTTVTSTFDVREAGRGQPATGAHEAERPVPRSGLAEYRSAGYLTGERPPTDEDAATTEGTPGAEDTAAAGLGGAGAATAEPADESAERTRRAVVLDGATAVTRPPSRAGAHVLTVLVTLLLTPVAWYLIADAGARLTLARNNPWESGDLNVAALLELGGGLLVLAVVLLAARWSSLGAIVTGSIVLVLGVPFLAAPTWTQEMLEPVVSWLERFGDFGGNVAHHLVASGSTGRLVVAGVALILVGVVSHGARRKGRREVRPVAETA